MNRFCAVWGLLAFVLIFAGCGGYKAAPPVSARYSNDMAMRATPESQINDEDSPQFNTEAYDEIVENEFRSALESPQSTFSIDVDTASYSNVRRLLNDGQLPPAGAVRIEELINYFSYDYPQPEGEHPFSVSTDLAACPWTPEHQLVRIALKGKEFDQSERPPSNLVFLLDVSGSMNQANKLPLVQSAMRMLVEELNENDRVAIVVYAGAAGLVLPSTTADQKTTILSAIDRLRAGGSTNGGQGIELAYQVAKANRIEGGTNRVIICTDGDFNVGTTSQSDLVALIQAKAASGIYLSVLGFGTGNYKDSTMEKLADKGNGNYAYIDSMLEARKALVQQMGATLITIAKDVKIQLDFNPSRISAYRLIGYENRIMANEDFRDDKKDAGEIGAGHTVTALYEIVPVGVESPARNSKPSEFVEVVPKEGVNPATLLTVSLRYKQPDGDTSQEFTIPLNHEKDSQIPAASSDLQFATAVAAFGMLLRKSKFAGQADWDWVVETAQSSEGEDHDGFRAEFVSLAKKARMMSKKRLPLKGSNGD